MCLLASALDRSSGCSLAALSWRSIFGSLSSYFLQLVLLPIIMVGQNVQGRHGEIQADEAFHATMNTLHDAEQMAQHLDKQDAELLRQTSELLKQTPMLQQVLIDLAKIRASIPMAPDLSPAVTIDVPTTTATPRKRTITAAIAKKESATNHV